jgi:hypothetical protein
MKVSRQLPRQLRVDEERWHEANCWHTDDGRQAHRRDDTNRRSAMADSGGIPTAILVLKIGGAGDSSNRAPN